MQVVCMYTIQRERERERETKTKEHETIYEYMNYKEYQNKSLQAGCIDQRFQTNSHVRFREPL